MTSQRRLELESDIIALIQGEIQDKLAILTRDTRRDEVEIDSIDIINVIFAVEEKYSTSVSFTSDSQFVTVGDLVDALIAFIPEARP